LGADSKQWSYGVDGESKIADGVERKVSWRRTAREKRASGIGCWRRRGSEMV
jgi:hypothetical protein